MPLAFSRNVTTFMNPISLLVGARYARGKNRNRFGSVVSLFSLIGMTLGVAALIIVLSVMNGFNQEIKLRFQSVAAHVSLVKTQPQTPTNRPGLDQVMATHPLVDSWSPFVDGYGLLSTDYAQAPGTIQGILPSADRSVVSLEEHMLYGSLDNLEPGKYGVILGSYLARLLYVRPGDSVQLVLPEIQIRPTGLYPRQKRFTVVGIFESGSQLDGELMYLHIEDAAKMLRMTEQDYGYRVRLTEENQIAEFLAGLEDMLEPGAGWRAETWSNNYESLFKAMQMEKATVGLLLMVIVLVAAFNIVSGLVMMVSDKRSDMAVIRTMGAETLTVVRIFVVQGMILGLSGIILGAVIGTVLAFNLSEIVSLFERLSGSRLFDPNVFYVSFLPTEWMLSDFLWVTGVSFILTLIATIIPAWQASRITPTEALSYKH